MASHLLKVDCERVSSTAADSSTGRFRPLAITADDARRDTAEAFIAEGFARHYGARVYHYMPQLVALLAPSGELAACLGVRSAVQPLFVEHYLDQPIEQAAPELALPRQQIVEIGNLVSDSRHATLLLFMMTAVSLHRVGFREMVFCATRKIAAILTATGARLQPIVEADGRRLGASLPEWGSYYDTRPVVMRLNLAAVVELIGKSSLLRRLSADYELAIDDLVPVLQELA